MVPALNKWRKKWEPETDHEEAHWKVEDGCWKCKGDTLWIRLDITAQMQY